MTVRTEINEPGWQFGLIAAEHFTDVIGVSPSGQLHVRKVCPNWVGQETPECAEHVTFCQPTEGAIRTVKVGTTVATNALLDEKESLSSW